MGRHPLKTPLRVLLVEDASDDAELIVRELAKSGYEPKWTRVDNEVDFLAHLGSDLELILADFEMPIFNGVRALQLLKASHLDIPFIIISGTIGEELAVSVMKQGADDYFIKDRLARLGQSVEHLLEKHRLEAQSRLANEALRLQTFALAGVSQGVIIADEHWRIIYVNASFTTITGYRAEDIIGRTSSILQGPGTDPATLREIRDALQSQTTFDGEILNYRADGTPFWNELSIAPIFDPHGGPVRYVGIQHDITRRKAFQETLLWKTAFFECLMECVPNGVFVVDRHGKRIHQNQWMNFLFGIPEEISGNPDDTVQVAFIASRTRHPEAFAARVAHLYAHPEAIDRSEIELLNGTILDRYSSPVKDENGNYYGRIWTFRDITEQKRAEEKLHEQASMVDQTRDAILVSRFHDRVITFWSRGAERLFGWTAEEALGKDVAEFISIDSHAPDDIRQALLKHDDWQGETRHKTKAGKEIIVNARGTLLRDADGEPRSVLSINTDITEQRELEAQFLRAQRMESLGTLANGIAHDLNNILSPIMMSAPLLRYELPEDQRESIISTIEISAERGAQIVKQVLTFGRGIEGERHLLHLSSLIKEMVKIMRETFPKNIAIDTRLGNRVSPVLGDGTQIHQILLNLCVNARDAMPEGGTLTLAAEDIEIDAHYAGMIPEATPGPYVLLTVSDTGSGIPQHIIERIFDPFFTTKDIGKGTGLGLSTVLGIVKSHGGFIRVDSPPGKGTQFSIYLCAETTGQVAPATSPETEPIHGHGQLILVVDDEASIREITQQTLESFGYRAIVASDGAEAIALYASHIHEVAAVITDLMMPGVDGITAIQILRKMNPKLPIVCASGLATDEHKGRAVQLGVQHFLPKPYRSGKMLTVLQEIFAKPTAA